jgi:hypothetical protein
MTEDLLVLSVAGIDWGDNRPHPAAGGGARFRRILIPREVHGSARQVEIWRAIQNKTANFYVIEITM